MQVAVVKDLAQRYTAKQLEECLLSEIDCGSHSCTIPISLSNGDRDGTIDNLAKAQAVREQMERSSITLSEALRDLAKRIRTLQEIR